MTENKRHCSKYAPGFQRQRNRRHRNGLRANLSYNTTSGRSWRNSNLSASGGNFDRVVNETAQTALQPDWSVRPFSTDSFQTNWNNQGIASNRHERSRRDSDLMIPYCYQNYASTSNYSIPSESVAPFSLSPRFVQDKRPQNFHQPFTHTYEGNRNALWNCENRNSSNQNFSSYQQNFRSASSSDNTYGSVSARNGETDNYQRQLINSYVTDSNNLINCEGRNSSSRPFSSFRQNFLAALNGDGISTSTYLLPTPVYDFEQPLTDTYTITSNSSMTHEDRNPSNQYLSFFHQDFQGAHNGFGTPASAPAYLASTPVSETNTGIHHIQQSLIDTYGVNGNSSTNREDRNSSSRYFPSFSAFQAYHSNDVPSVSNTGTENLSQTLNVNNQRIHEDNTTSETISNNLNHSTQGDLTENNYSSCNITIDLDIQTLMNPREISKSTPFKCGVCLEDYDGVLKNGAHLVAISCGHVFCSLCTHIFMVSRKCPICRSFINYRNTLHLYI